MNHPIRRVAALTLALTLALLVNISAAYLTRTESLNARSNNRRVTDDAVAQGRGAILVGNTAVADTKAVKDRYKF